MQRYIWTIVAVFTNQAEYDEYNNVFYYCIDYDTTR